MRYTNFFTKDDFLLLHGCRIMFARIQTFARIRKCIYAYIVKVDDRKKRDRKKKRRRERELCTGPVERSLAKKASRSVNNKGALKLARYLKIAMCCGIMRNHANALCPSCIHTNFNKSGSSCLVGNHRTCIIYLSTFQFQVKLE